jgi:hypothetical protein
MVFAVSVFDPAVKPILVIVGATVSIVVVLLRDPAPAVFDALTTPVAFTVAITVPSRAEAFERVNR